MEALNVLENKILGQEEIRQIIPHRGRWLLLDEIVKIQEKFIIAIKTFTMEECEGHFGIAPGHLICEALAQAGAALVLSRCLHKEKMIFLVRTRADFLVPVMPMEKTTLEVELVREKMGMCFFRGRALVGLRKSVEWDGVGTLR